MRSKIENLSSLERKLNVEVPAETVQKTYEKIARDWQKQVAVKGFRKGKVPLSTVKSLYSEQMGRSIVEELINEHMHKALHEHSVKILGQPKKVNYDDFALDKNFEFTVEFEVRPEIKFKKIEGLTIKKEKLNVDDKWVDDAVEDFRYRFAELKPVLEDRGLQSGDVAKVDIQVFVDGNEIEALRLKEHTFEATDEGNLIPGFLGGLIGIKINEERTIPLDIPEDHPSKEMAGKTADFKVKLVKLESRDLPEVNDEFAKKVSAAQTVEELRKNLRESFVKREERRINDDMRSRVVRALVEANPLEVPQSLIAEQRESLIKDFEGRLKQDQMTPEGIKKFIEDNSKDFDMQAASIVKAFFLVDQLADDQKLYATKEDFKNYIEKYAQEIGVEADRIAKHYKSDDMKWRLERQITEGKVVDFILEKAQVVELTPEQLKD